MKWSEVTKEVTLPVTGQKVRIKRIDALTFLEMLDQGDLIQKPSVFAKIVLPKVIVEPRDFDWKSLPPADILTLIDEIVRHSELNKFPEAPKAGKAVPGKTSD